MPARTVQDLDVDWPSLTVVINAFNAEATLEECLSHCERLDYPELELLVVDDGSTDATPQIARAHPRVRLVQVPHGGLGAGRNAGWQAARGELVAYLDADAYPTPEWPWYLALAARGERVGACGGPNVPPAHEPRSARAVACAPGGPVPVLEGPARAQHIPGCNMAYWRSGLEAIGGFDPVFDAACDDVELQWRLFDAGLEISYHPAALVWHHRRPGLRPYLRQQRHYGRSQALLERRYPERFPPGYRFRQALGAVSPLPKARARAPVYEVRYLALPRGDGALIGLAHQWGVPVACGLFLTAPAGLWRRRLGAPAVAAAAFICALFFIDVGAAGQGRRRSGRRLDVRLQVATFRVLRPLAFRWGYLRDRAAPDQGRRGRRSGSVGAPPAEHGGDGLKQDRQVEQHRPAL